MQIDTDRRLDRSVIDGPNPEVIVSTKKGVHLRYDDIARLSSKDLVNLRLKVVVAGEPLHISIWPVYDGFGRPTGEMGTGYLWRCMGRGNDPNESALEILDDAYGTSQCWTGTDWIT